MFRSSRITVSLKWLQSILVQANGSSDSTTLKNLPSYAFSSSSAPSIRRQDHSLFYMYFSMLLYFLPSPSYASSFAPTHTHTYSHFLCFSPSLSSPPVCWVNCNFLSLADINRRATPWDFFFSPLYWMDLLETSSLAGPWHLNPLKGYNSGWDGCTLNLIFIPIPSFNQRSSQFYIYLFIELRISCLFQPCKTPNFGFSSFLFLDYWHRLP